MNNFKNDIIKIVYSAVTDVPQKLSSDFDLNEAIKIAKKHDILSMFYYGALNCGISSQEAQMQNLFLSTCQSMVVSEQQMHAINDIFSAFNEGGIDYLPLKGTLLKKMYPKTEMRSMGDADILIKTDQYDKIKPIMENLGYAEIDESDHELIWKKSLINIELHKRLIPSYNKDYYTYFGDGWRLAKIKNGTRYDMTDEDQMVYLFTHYAKHYRDGGIGIRHIIDLWVYRKIKPDLDEKYIETELKALQLYDFYLNTIKTLAVWFENGVSDEITELITDFIFSSGVYGTMEAHIIAEAVRKSKSTQTSKNVKKKEYLYLIFLPFADMCVKYPFLKKCPVLLPVMWIVRIVDALLFNQKGIEKQQKRVDKMSSDNIDSYSQALNLVGLDFNFKE